MNLIYNIKGHENYCFDENKILWKLPEIVITKSGEVCRGIRRIKKQKNNNKKGYWISENGKQKFLYMSKIQRLLQPCNIQFDIFYNDLPK